MMAMDKEALGKRHPSEGLTRIEPAATSSGTDGFVYIVSHDLRNSARALIEVPQWLREDLDKQGVTLDEDLAENFDLLERHARRLDQMLLDLLAYSRVGRLQPVTGLPLDALIGDVLAENPLPAHVALRIDGELPHLLMGCQDAFLLIKCVLDNVAKHGMPQGVTLTVTGERRNDEVTLTFADDGPGVSGSDIQRIFRPMTTLRRRDEVEGSGMGLAIVQRIADHYHGDVWAGAGPDGRGFRVTMRLVDAALPASGGDEVIPVTC